MTPLIGWQNFYVIVGSSAGALIGLQFVVMTLISDIPVKDTQEQAGAAFATPTIVHFGAVLLLAAVQCSPWEQLSSAAFVWGVLGVTGILYQFIVVRRMRSQSVYKPVFEDHLFHAVLPFAAYILLAASAALVGSYVSETLFVIAAAALILLFVGIHNAWDAVTYHVFAVRKKYEGKKGK